MRHDDLESRLAAYRQETARLIDKFASERESYRAEAEADLTADAYEHEHDAGVLSEDERFAFQAGLKVGERTERARILDGLAHLERDTAALWFAASPVTVAVAAYTAAVRRVVEGKA